MKKSKIIYAIALLIAMVGGIYFAISTYQNMENVTLLAKVNMRPNSYQDVEKTRVEDGVTYVTGHTYYIEFEFPFYDEMATVWLSSRETYGKNDVDIVRKAIENQEYVQGSLFLVGEDKVDFSKKSDTLEEYKREELINALLPWIMIFLLFAFPNVYMLIGNMVKGKKLKNIAKNRPNAVICTGITDTFAMIEEVSLILAGFGVGTCFTNSDDYGAILCGISFIVEGIVMFILAFMYMWNRMVVFDTDTIIYTNALGKEKTYSKEDIIEFKSLNYGAYNNASGRFRQRKNFIIKVRDGKIAINTSMSNYYEAMNFVYANYGKEAERKMCCQ